ncbi:DUF695 domain-containing protein [Nocardioides sp. MH1]|uniref:DUF695 domain-containing protein n=1 Tax=Nocardioides sp. MH1 TaxID=3242490 RepID=UPI0035211F87
MRLFGRRRPDDPDAMWSLAQGVVDGHPTILRRKHTRRDRSRPVRVTVKLGVARPDEHGFPDGAEMDQLSEIEEQLFTELEQHGAELVLVITANRAREFIAYGADHEWLEAWGPTVLERWAEGRPGTGVEAALEPDWATYRAFPVR